jgi:hypothetical protein
MSACPEASTGVGSGCSGSPPTPPAAPTARREPATALEAIIADTAHTLALDALDRGDTRLAVFAAQQGLLASPNSEALTRDLLAAHVAAGDRTMASRLLAEYERALEDIGGGEPPTDCYELVEPPTAS